MRRILFLLCFLSGFYVIVNAESFRFALFTDLHVQMANNNAANDLIAAVEDVNALNDIDFIIVSGDITEHGDLLSLQKAKGILDKLHKPYYITLGNHETKWSESGCTDFSRVFGDDKFSFMHKGIYFIGFATGPIIKMGDGHIVPQDIEWVKNQLDKLIKNQKIIAITHYPLQNGDVDNWYDMTDVLRKYNVQAVLNGHYHRNALLNYDGLPGIINRSTLSSKDTKGGYSLYTISDTLQVFEKIINKEPRHWLDLLIEDRNYGEPNASIRPSFDVNKLNKNIKTKWLINSKTAIYTSPFIANKKVYYGDDLGVFHCLSLENGKSIWSFKTKSRIISSPAVGSKQVVFGSTDGNIYSLDAETGKQNWKFETSKAVMGCPLIQNDTVFIGSSDGFFRAINLNSGKLIWEFGGIQNYIETRAVLANGKVMFGAWDSYFYALNSNNGNLVWKWNNEKTTMHLSPAAVLPVVADNKVFITAPDRFWTALDINTGKVIWRTNQHEVRETIGISSDKKVVYSRCMNDSVVAISTQSDTPKVLWKTYAGFGYDHNPSMLIENKGTIIFGTKNGLLLGINAKNGSVNWRYKIGNSIINTIAPISKNECVLTTTEGLIIRLKY